MSKGAILFLHPSSEWYGADKILYSTVRALKKSFTCIVCLPEDGILVPKLRELGVEVHIIPFPALRRKYFNPWGLCVYLWQFLQTFPSMVRICLKAKTFAIHANTLAILQGALLKVLLRQKHVWHVHEIILTPKIFPRMLRIVANLLADQVVVVSEAVGTAFGARRTLRIYNGIAPVARISSRTRGAPYVVGMLGRFNSWKGQIDLLLACEELHRRGLFPQVVGKVLFCGGVYAGDTRHLDAFKAHLAKSPIRQYVEVMDFTENIAAIYDMLDVFILPSTSPDPFPTVVLEAMSLGLPVVGYDHGGIKEMLGSSGALVKPCDPVALADAISRVVASQEAMEQAGTTSLARFDAFSLAEFERNFNGLYEGLAASKR